MTTYTISGVTHDPNNPSVTLRGIWTVRDYDQCVCTDGSELTRGLERPASVYVFGGRSASLTLPETTGERLYWAEFTSDDRTLSIGPFLFDLTTNRTWDDLIANPAPTPGGGGSGGIVLDGPQYQCEITVGQVIQPDSGAQPLSWDTVDPALGSPGINLVPPVGLYLAEIELDFDLPDASWSITLSSAGIDGFLSPADGPKPIIPGTDVSSRIFQGQLTLRIPESVQIGFTVRPSCDPLAVAPTALNVNYGLLVLTKLDAS